MAQDHNWQFDLDEYIKQGEPDRCEKSAAWKAAIGLQDVDGLHTSDYLLETAKEHIEGKIDISTAVKRISGYYEQRDLRMTAEQNTMEADIVASHITELLAENTFQFSPAELQSIHRRLFTGVFKSAGQYRTYNISKKEWVLNGASVFYASYDSIRDTLDYDFNQEKAFSYVDLDVSQAIKHIAKFISGVWQIHPFCEGNTRTTAVFMIKYLKTFGFNVSNQVFADNSWYFRNALVRANYNNLQNGIHATTAFLEQFVENLLLGTNHELKNRYLHIDYHSDAQRAIQSANPDNSKCQNCTLDELALLQAIAKNPSATQKALADSLGISERTIKRRTVELQNKGFLRRKNGKRNGQWEVLVEV
ncbi:MAG: Fic family protein [Clostridia bacterium]|nr:Fic family protein [Clostridia bacterium]